MKSTLIALENQKINSDILNLLIRSLKCEISVVFATPETLISIVKKNTRHNDAIFICSEFLDDLENRTAYFDIFGEDCYSTDESGKITGLYSLIKSTPVGILPSEILAAQKFINSYFVKNELDEEFEFNSTGSVFIATESTEYIERTLCEILANKNPLVSINTQNLYTEISVTAFGTTQDEADTLLTETKEQLRLLLGDDVYSTSTNKMEQEVVKLLIDNSLKIATAESCTGGLMSQLITSVPNSSSVFEIGITSYSNRIKQYALSVNKDTVKNYGAVSKQTAVEMALGVKKLSGADIGVAITGVAGPSSSEGKPVGTVYVALTDGAHFWVRRLNLSPFLSRDEIRSRACFTAFDLVRRYIECLPTVLPEFSTDIQNISCLFEQPHYINSSLLFMRDSLSDYLTEEEAENSEIEASAEDVEIKIPNSAPLQKLRKKVIKKHGVKFRFKLPSINFSIKDYIYQITTTTDLKGFILGSLTKVAALILVSAILMATVVSIDSFTQNYSDLKLINNLRSYWSDSDIKNTDGTFYDYNKLNKINPDISGWLTINGTEINNPVCLYKENDFYKTKNYEGKSSKFGALYFGENTDLENGKINTVIYGNNLSNGAMFSDLSNYKDKEYANKAQKIKLSTKKKTTNYEVFAVLTLTDNPAHEKKDDFFDYTKTEFKNEYDFTLWISRIKLRSLYDCALSIDYSDKILTLVTDSFEFPSAKTVVFARAITTPSVTTKYPLTVNSEPKLPYIWYQINNLKSPYHYSEDFIVKNN